MLNEAEKRREYRRRNADKIRLFKRRWRLDNPDKVRAMKARHYLRHRDQIRARVKAWATRNKDKVRERSRRRRREQLDQVRFWARRWAAKNAHKLLAYCNKRRAIIERPLTPRQKLAIDRVYARAAVLRRWFNVVVDHVVPLARGGEHLASNLQIIYAKENERKNARTDYKPSVIFR